MESAKIRELLKQTAHHDKDERFMAISDLTEELEKVEGRLDPGLQVPIRDAIMTRLTDASNDVQTQACNSLSAIVKKFEVKHVDSIVDKLGELLVNGTMEQRDIYTIALKNILSSVHDDFGAQISKTLCNRLLQGLKMACKRDGDTQEEKQEHYRNYLNRLFACLDITKDLCARFGFVMTRDSHQALMDTTLPMLNAAENDLRKKTANTLGSMVAVVDDKLFDTLMTRIIAAIKSMKAEDVGLFTYIQTIGVFSRNGGKRVSAYLGDVVPLLLDICGNEELNTPSEGHIELRDNCLQAFETLIQQCPKEIDEYSDKLLDIALQLMKFDPMYTYDEDVEMGEEAKDEDDDGFGDDDDWGDDDGGDGWGADAATEDVGMDSGDDITWKIRRAAIKMIRAFVITHKRKITEHQIRLAEELLAQFREHEATVKLELFTTFRELLLATIVADSGLSTGPMTSLDAPALVRQKSDFHIIAAKLDDIMAAVVKELGRSTATVAVKSGLLGIVRDLVVVRQAERSVNCEVLPADGLVPYFPTLVPEIVKCVNNSDTQLKNQGLYVLYLILSLHSPKDGLSIVSVVNECVTEAVGHDYSRVKAQALMTVARIFTAIRPLNSESSGDSEEKTDGSVSLDYDKSAYDEIIKKMFAAAFAQLSLKDVEQEVKKATLNAVAVGIAQFGDLLAAKTPETLKILLSRLQNEVTTISSLKAFATICRSPLGIDLSPMASDLVVEMAKFLKKHSQALKITATESLTALYGSSIAVAAIAPSNTEALIKQSSAFICDADLQLCHFVLDLVTQIMNANADACSVVSAEVLPAVYKFLESPLIQGQALLSLRKLVNTFQSVSKGKVAAYSTIKDSLIGAAKPDLNRQSYIAIAQCLATLTLGSDDATRKDAVAQLVVLIGDSSEAHVQVALLSLGEIGRDVDMSVISGIETKIFAGFSHESESVKWAASFALGNIAVGNLTKFVPVLLGMISKSEGRQYLLLNSLKEVIDFHSTSDELRGLLLPFSKTIVPLLLGSAGHEDEGTRGMVAECTGRIAIIDASVYDSIEKLLKDSNVFIRSTMAASLKYSLIPSMNTSLPRTVLAPLLELLKDSDLGVKRSCFLTIVTILHVNYRMIITDLPTLILPVIYKHTATDVSLIREMDLGPFKHRVDDGLPLRKASFQCMDTLIDSAPNVIDLHDFLGHLKNGFVDENMDIQMITYQILYRLGRFHGPAIVAVLDDLPEALMKGIKAKMKEAKSEKDGERAKDILRATLKALFCMRTIPTISKAPKFCTFVQRVEKTKSLQTLIDEIKAKGNR